VCHQKFVTKRLGQSGMSAQSGSQGDDLRTKRGQPGSFETIREQLKKRHDSGGGDFVRLLPDTDLPVPFLAQDSGQSHLAGSRGDLAGLPEERLKQAVARFALYLREERETYYPQGRSLNEQSKRFYGRFFSMALLEQVKVVGLVGRRVENPPFYAKAREMGFANLPDVAHKDSVTFLDALVFNERITERNLFHALVHAAQVRVLGIYQFADLFVRGFLRTKSYSMVPLKAQAFELDMRFASDREGSFSVEGEVLRWLTEKRL
jgi:hypothetical protein